MIVLAVLGAAILAVWLYLAATTETVGVEILSIMGVGSASGRPPASLSCSVRSFGAYG
jgi:hypothetical protein